MTTLTSGWWHARRVLPDLGTCTDCPDSAVERHHVDGDVTNNAPSNLVPLCRRCHMKRDGRLDALRAMNPQPKRAKACRTCGRDSTPLRHGECSPCAQRTFRAERVFDPTTRRYMRSSTGGARR